MGFSTIICLHQVFFLLQLTVTSFTLEEGIGVDCNCELIWLLLVALGNCCIEGDDDILLKEYWLVVFCTCGTVGFGGGLAADLIVPKSQPSPSSASTLYQSLLPSLSLSSYLFISTYWFSSSEDSLSRPFILIQRSWPSINSVR